MQWFKKKNAWILLTILVILSCILSSGALNSELDYDFEKFFPPNDTETAFFESYRENFENDYDFLLIGFTNQKGIFDTTFLQKLKNTGDTLGTLNNVIDVRSIATLKIPLLLAGGIAYRPYVHLHNDSLLSIDSVRLNETKELEGAMISFDQKTTCLILQTKERLSKKASDQLLSDIEGVLAESDFDEVRMAGKIKAQHVYLSKMQREIFLFLSINIVLVIIFLGVTYRSASKVIVPLVVVLLSVVWQVGAMHYLGKKIDILTTLVPTILFIVGMSDVIHILSKYLEELRLGNSKIPALVKTVKEVGLATLLTSFTTALGFLTLTTSNISVIREFGIYTALGVLIAYVLAITLLPSILLLIPAPKSDQKNYFSATWTRLLRGQFKFILGHQKLIVVVACVLLVTTGIGIKNLKVDNKLLEDISAKEQLAKDFAFFETKFSGGRPFEMMLESKQGDEDILSFESLKEMEMIQNIAIEKFQIGFIQSPITLVKMLNRSLNSGLNEYYRLPQTQEEHNRLFRQLKSSGILNNPETQKLITSDFKKGRISGKMDDLGSYRVNKMEKDFVASLPPLDHLNYRITGSARLIDKNIAYLSGSLMKGLAIAIIIVALAFGLLYRSWRMIVIAIITNLIPMVCIAGIMGYTGIDIKVSTSIIFTIAFGIAVDDTIHFLSRFKIEQKSGKSTIYAVKRSFMSTGKAMILTSMILCAGFVTMVTSSFMSIFYIGFLLSITLFIALIVDLYLLPILLINFGIKTKKN